MELHNIIMENNRLSHVYQLEICGKNFFTHEHDVTYRNRVLHASRERAEGLAEKFAEIAEKNMLVTLHEPYTVSIIKVEIIY